LPTIIADNGGYDSADLIAKLRAAHTEGKATYGLGMIICVLVVVTSEGSLCPESEVLSHFLRQNSFLYVVFTCADGYDSQRSFGEACKFRFIVV